MKNGRGVIKDKGAVDGCGNGTGNGIEGFTE